MRFQFSDAGFGADAGFPFGVSAGFGGIALGLSGAELFVLFLEVRQVALSQWVIQAEFAVFPTEVEVQGVAVPPVMLIVYLGNGYRLVFLTHQPVPGQRDAVKVSACGVEAPVFGNANPSVVPALFVFINASGAFRRHLQHEVGWLALLRDEVTVAGDDSCGVGVEGDE